MEYLKLHGSIDWWVRERDGRIVVRDCFHSLMGETYGSRLMIYPAYDKKISRDPFSSLYNHFRKLLSMHEVYIVVGYSFRDSSINDAFADALSRVETRMVMNPNPDRIRNKITNFPQRRIDVITKPFGGTELLLELNHILRRRPSGYQ